MLLLSAIRDLPVLALERRVDPKATLRRRPWDRLASLEKASNSANGPTAWPMLVLHDDAARKYAYGPARGPPDGKLGTFTAAREAKKNGWTIISTKNDWGQRLPILAASASVPTRCSQYQVIAGFRYKIPLEIFFKCSS